MRCEREGDKDDRKAFCLSDQEDVVGGSRFGEEHREYCFEHGGSKTSKRYPSGEAEWVVG